MYRQIFSVPIQISRKSRFLKSYQSVRLIQTTSNHYKDEGKEPPKKPCPKSGSGRGFYYTLGAVIIGTGSIVAYAKYDEDFRKWLSATIPGSDSFISFMAQEETTHIDYITRAITHAKDNVVLSVSNLLGLSDEKEQPPAKDEKTSKKSLPPCDDEGKPYSPKKAVEEKTKKLEDAKQKKAAASDPRADEKAKLAKPKTEVKEKSAETKEKKGVKNAVDIQKEIEDKVNEAVKAYTEAIHVLKRYTGEVNAIVEDSVEKQDPKIWPELRKKSQVKDDSVQMATDIASEAEVKLKQLNRDLIDSGVGGTDEEKKESREKAKEAMKKLKDSKDEFNREKNLANVTNLFWSLVQQAREHFQDELETLFPNFSITDKQMKLAEAEMDLFILYAFQTILYYQKELTKLDTLGQEKLKNALEKSRIGDPEAIQCVIEQEVEKEKRKICSDYQKKLLNLKAECEVKAKDAIKTHNTMHTEMLQDALAQKEKDTLKKMRRQMEEQLTQEKRRYKEEMASLLGRLKGMDDLMKNRAGQERRATEAQLLWSACESLVSAITCEKNCTAVSMRSLAKEIKSIKAVAPHDDELVQAVLASIPKEAIDRGIFGEPALKERFTNTERVARRVALLPEGGSSLPVMLISYLQSLLVISPAIPIPAHELNNEPINPSSLNTFEILQRSKFWVDRGDWYQVLRYMNLLKGASRVVAQDFIDEVRIFLETKQAADVLISFASSAALAM